MRVSTRIAKLLPAGALALCAAAFAAGGSAQDPDIAEICKECVPPGPDRCLDIVYPDGTTITCWHTRKTPVIEAAGPRTASEPESGAGS